MIKSDNKKRLNKQFEEFYQKIDENLEARFQKLNEEDAEIRARLDNIEKELTPLKDGVLSLHRRKFIDDCRDLLQDGKTISSEDYDRVEKEYHVYKGLGGNHSGDAHWTMFAEKYKSQFYKGA